MYVQFRTREYLIKLCNIMSYTSVLSFFLNVCRPRPWLVDDLDEWRSRLTGGDEVKKVPHKCAAIFIDNSGVDVVLGVIPFVQFLLGRGTEVILCANNRPVLNDVTYAELVTLVQVTNKCFSFLWHLNNDNIFIGGKSCWTKPSDVQ